MTTVFIGLLSYLHLLFLTLFIDFALSNIILIETRIRWSLISIIALIIWIICYSILPVVLLFYAYLLADVFGRTRCHIISEH